MKYFILSLILLLSSCTQTMTMVHTQGQADDVIDDTSSITPNIAPVVTVPLTPGSSIDIAK